MSSQQDLFVSPCTTSKSTLKRLNSRQSMLCQEVELLRLFAKIQNLAPSSVYGRVDQMALSRERRIRTWSRRHTLNGRLGFIKSFRSRSNPVENWQHACSSTGTREGLDDY
ncbi:hypothetical protein HER10_EVM0012706 [Colletotrichum scovillei]|uniref:uncharacterized protein n=1 Tax=Colletotrichum scovillei TaxID=1209932 RepID=UPI0015C3EFE3|nr:uncharacterized protein HER10_EVM0012706 [Colletotrichum scovillei]KAF4777236.1 hypothetical protein HER10_EVM0012706 [Colletotrichum scovillei]